MLHLLKLRQKMFHCSRPLMVMCTIFLRARALASYSMY